MIKKSQGFIRSSLLRPQGQRLVFSALRNSGKPWLCNITNSGLLDTGGEEMVVSSQSTPGGKVSSSALGFDDKLI